VDDLNISQTIPNGLVSDAFRVYLNHRKASLLSLGVQCINEAWELTVKEATISVKAITERVQTKQPQNTTKLPTYLYSFQLPTKYLNPPQSTNDPARSNHPISAHH
jgi:hypothetical protein